MSDSKDLDKPGPSFPEIAKETFLSWEWLRLVYISILAILTLMFARSSIAKMESILFVIESAIALNICFFAGPVFETYIRWLGFNHKAVRWVLFSLGTAVSAAFVVASFVGGLIPTP